MEAEPMKASRVEALLAMAGESYQVSIDLRELAFLCNSALQLRMLSDAIRILAAKATIRDEGARLVELLDGLSIPTGDLT